MSSGTDDDVAKLIHLRREKDHLFSGKWFASAAGWNLHDMSIEEEELDENTFNDHMNSVIDWAEEGPTFHSDPDDSSDEEYLPSISLRMGGALKGAQVIDNLPTIGIDETVHDLPAPEVLSDESRAANFARPSEGDGRNDSPGHSAQYCSYTTMELDTKEIVHVATIDKRQTNWNSNIMEKEGFIQTVEKLTKELKVEEFSTDAHVQIGESTSHLESFQNHILSFRKKYNKNARRYSLYALKCEKSYGYIPELQAQIVKGRVASGVGMPRKRALRPDDPRQLGVVPPIPPPPTSELVRTQVSRGLGSAF
ncbi:hypothetical protein F2P81_007453 [Scophthalmus maximus]|uniref:Uncharacterized protein n=1 Tax=Scophthalmus maximus TaxID=52904 RepID=A0A6A4T4F1_SCOMX|nr:hypothetical protein F2P81_007453 [Scophthalmus maximus]